MFHDMFLDLRILKPNPRRDFTVNPADEMSVNQLTVLMQQGKFWDGVVCWKTTNGIQVAVGHARIRAALKAGITSAHITVISDERGDVKRVRTPGFPVFPGWPPRS